MSSVPSLRHPETSVSGSILLAVVMVLMAAGAFGSLLAALASSHLIGP